MHELNARTRILPHAARRANVMSALGHKRTCAVHQGCPLSAKSRHCTYRVRPSEISLLSIFPAFTGCTRVPWTIEHGCAGGTELLFVVGKAKGHAAHIWNSACAEPHSVRCAGICIRLSIGNCWQGAVIMIVIMTKATALNLRMTLHSNTPVLMRVTRRSSTRKLGARLSPRLRALVDRFAKSRDGGFDHSVLSWAVP